VRGILGSTNASPASHCILQGDSGGPIIDESSGEPVQMGVVSFGIGCARSNYNGVYARVSSATEWIDRMICELSDYPPAGCPAKPDNGGIGNGNGKVKISIKYDDYPTETGFAFIHDGTGKRLHFQPFHYPGATKRGTAYWSWDGLPAGDYRVQVGDEGKDGIW
jgi:Trypsin